jgi:hypothetical protein
MTRVFFFIDRPPECWQLMVLNLPGVRKNVFLSLHSVLICEDPTVPYVKKVRTFLYFRSGLWIRIEPAFYSSILIQIMPVSGYTEKKESKGTVSRDFRPSVFFFIEQSPHAPDSCALPVFAKIFEKIVCIARS